MRAYENRVVLFEEACETVTTYITDPQQSHSEI